MRLLAGVTITILALTCCVQATNATQQASDAPSSSVAAESSPALIAEAANDVPAGPVAKESHVLSTRALPDQPANLTTTVTEVTRARGRAFVTAFGIAGTGSNGAPGTVQPGVGVWDESTSELRSDVQINTPPNGNYNTAVANQGHDAPAVARTANGIIVPYGAASTYKSYHAPESWSCFGSFACEPFKFASAGDASIAEALARSPEYLLPATGISEISSATVGDTTILAGQQQTSSPHGEAGAQGYVAFHASGDGGTFDTAAGPWNFRSSHAPSDDGLQTITRTPLDDAYADFAVSSSGGQGTISITVNGAACSMPNIGGDAQTVAQAFATFASQACPALDARFGVVPVRYDPTQRGAAAIVGVTLKRGDVRTLPSPLTAIALACSGAIACSSPRGSGIANDVRGSGLHRHFLWGGVTRLGRYVYDILDVQQVTGSWYGAGHNSLALAIACFRSAGPSNGEWTWTDCAGRHPFEVAPGRSPENRLSLPSPYLIGPPAHGYAPDMQPYIYDWSMGAQPVAGKSAFPVISAEGVALLGDDLIVAHGCQTRSLKFGICYARYDTRTGTTLRAGFVEAPAGGGSLASLALRTDGRGVLTLAALAGLGQRWGCDRPGPCAIVYRYDDRGERWTRVSAESVGGANDSGFPGTVAADGRGFLFRVKQREAETARLITFERTAP